MIATDEAELVRNRMTTSFRAIIADVLGFTLGAVVVLIGLALLCSAAVAALSPVIPQLWLRLVVMAVIYGALGGVVAYRCSIHVRHRLGGGHD